MYMYMYMYISVYTQNRKGMPVKIVHGHGLQHYLWHITESVGIPVDVVAVIYRLVLPRH